MPYLFDNNKLIISKTKRLIKSFFFLFNSKAYYRDADCVICMFDVTLEKSFHNLRNWIATIREMKDNTKIKIVIIGTKIDLIQNNNLKFVQPKEAEAFALVILKFIFKFNYEVISFLIVMVFVYRRITLYFF